MEGTSWGEVEDLKKKVYHLEYDELKEVKGNIEQLKVDMATNNMLTKQSIDTTQKLVDTLDAMKTTMLDLSYTIESNNKTTNELANKVEGLENKFGEFSDKTKFDILQYIKDNWMSIAMFAGFITYVVAKG